MLDMEPLGGYDVEVYCTHGGHGTSQGAPCPQGGRVGGQALKQG